MINVSVLRAVLQLNDDLSPHLNKAASNIGKFGAMVGKALAGAAAAIAAATAASVAMVTKFAGEIADLSAKSALSTTFLQEMKVAAGQVGVSLEQVATSTLKLQQNIGRIGGPSKEVSSALEAIGLSVSELRALRPEDQFTAVAQAIASIQDPTEQVAVGTALMGRGFNEVLPLIRSEFEKTVDEARELGLILSEDVVAAADKTGDRFDILGQALRTTAMQVGGAIVQSSAFQDTLEAVIDVVGRVNQWIITNRSEISSWVNIGIIFAVDALRFLVTAAALVVTGLGVLGRTVLEIQKTFIDWGIALLNHPIAAFIPGIALFRENLVEMAQSMSDNLQTGIEFWTGIEETGHALDRSAVSLGDFRANLLRGIASGKDAIETNKQHTGGLVDLEVQFKKTSDAANILNKGMEQFEKIQRSNIDALAELDAQIQAADFAVEMEQALAKAARQQEINLAQIEREQILREDLLRAQDSGIVALDLEAETRAKLEENQRFFNDAIQTGADLMRLFGIEADSATGEILALGSQFAGALPAMLDFDKSIIAQGASLENLARGAQVAVQGVASLMQATSRGGAGRSALSGAASGAATGGQLGGPWGALIGAGVGALVGFFRGRGRERAMEAIGRDIGVEISEGLLEEIRKGGESAQLALTEIFAEGNLGIDRFAEEVGDLFSMFERGEITEGTLITELKEDLPILIEHFQELGPEGQMQLERIIAAAKDAGIEIEELGEIIALTLDNDEVLAIVDQLGVTQAAAEALGLTFDQLQTKVKSIFAPETLETLAQNFGKTTEEMRQILKDLGVNVQTDLERLAAEAGLSVEDFRALGAAFQAATGIPAEKLAEFLKQSGQTAADLAASLGVDVSASLGTAGEELAKNNAELAISVENARVFAFEMERAARAIGSMDFPDIPSVPGIPTTGAQHGFHGDVVGPRGFFIEPGVRERVDIGPAGHGTGASLTFNITNHFTVQDGHDAADRWARSFEKNLAGVKSRVKKELGL